jgi:hypothetical protein
MDEKNDRASAPFLNVEIDATGADHPAFVPMGPIGRNGQGKAGAAAAFACLRLSRPVCL